MSKIEIITITKNNLNNYPPRCFLKPDNPGQLQKNAWVSDRLSEGMRIKLLYLENKLVGYIEYIPGTYAWRAVDAKKYLFIHCIWMNPNKNKHKGYGSMLIQEALNDAIDQHLNGVAVVTSEGPFMVGKEVFIHNDFTVVATAQPSYTLLMKQTESTEPPSFMDYKKQLSTYKGLHIIYSHQCPWVSRSIPEMQEIATEKNIPITFHEITTAQQAQQAPSLYATFTFIKDGSILSEHYISTTRFKNILKKQKLL